MTETVLVALALWTSGEHSPEGLGVALIDRLKNVFGCDAQSTPTGALKARQVYIQSPKDLFPGNADRISYADGLEIVMLQVLLDVRFAVLSAFTDISGTVSCSYNLVDGLTVSDDRTIVTLAGTPNHFSAVVVKDDSDGDSDSDDSSVGSDSEDAGPKTTSVTSTTTTAPTTFRDASDPYAVILERDTFDNREKVVAFVRELASRLLPRLCITKSDERRVVVICKGEPNPKRPVLVFKPDEDGKWVVKENNEHFCASAGRISKYDKRTPNELLDLMPGLLGGSITTRTVAAALRTLSIRAGPTKISRVAELARTRLYGDIETNYATLRAFLLQHQAADSDFFFRIQSAMEGDVERFERVFVAPAGRRSPSASRLAARASA